MFAKNKTPSSVYLLFHALMPSTASLMTTSLLAILIIVVHCFVISLNNHIYPQIIDSSFAPSFETTFSDPMTRFVTNVTLNNGLGMLLWGVFGYLLYAGIAGITTSIHEWREARSEVRIAAGMIIQSPMHRSLLGRTIWRLAIGVIFVGFTIAAAPLIRHCLANDYQLMLEPSFAHLIKYAIQSVLLWMAIFHGFLILLRLYVMRTRVFGEIIY